MANIVLIPAAGVGSRFGAATPKQYALLCRHPMLQHTLDLFAHSSRIHQIFVVIAPDDDYFDDCIDLPTNAQVLRLGGETRAQTVANGLHDLLKNGLISSDDMILVHDAARCCLPQSALNRLLDCLAEDEHAQQHGALLALPVADTLKRQNDGQNVAQTISREGLWQAQTPQAFVAWRLREALNACDWHKIAITDDCSAVEYLGDSPVLVLGDARNIKITRAEDADWAEFFLNKGYVADI